MAIPGNFLSLTAESIDPNASGWRARLNCVLKLGVGGQNGPECLQTDAVAAGETQAETVSTYPVVPGETYLAFANAASGTEPERIGIEWLDEASTAVGAITWSLTTSEPSSGWHRVSVAGVAPAGATRARVVLSSTATAAGADHFWENVYLGFPIRTTGNLLPYNAESLEADDTAWEADANVTVTRRVPPVSWSSTNYLVGGHVLSAVAVAGGAFSARLTARPAVTPGTEYAAYAYLNPPVTGTGAAWIELRFHDADGVQLSASRGVLDAPGTGWYRQFAFGVAPAGAVSCSVAIGRDGGTAGQRVQAETVVVDTVVHQEGYAPIPLADASFEQGVGAWMVGSGVATLARSSPWGADAVDLAYSLAVSSATATTSSIHTGSYPVTEGLPWRMLIRIKAAETWNVRVDMRWFDALGTELSLVGSVVVPVTGGWYELSADALAPAGAASVRVEFQVTATTASSTLYLDWMRLRQVLPLVSVTADDERAAITLILRELDLDDALTVYREVDGQRTLVRGPDGLLDRAAVTGETMVIEDYEAPLGRPVRYRIELLAPGSTTPDTRASADMVSLDAGDVNEAWLKDPGNPHRNLRVLVHRAPDWSRPIEQAVHRVAGRRNAVVFSGTRGGLEGDLQIWTRTDDERAALHWLLDDGNTLLWQAAPGMGVDDLYVNVGAASEARVTAWAPELWRAWSLPMVEADMPVAVGVGGTSGRSWQDILSEFATWADVEAAYATWEDVMFDRRTGG